MSEEIIYATLGDLGFQRLVAAFYRRVKEDEIVGSMYPDDDWEGSEERLYQFLLFRFGKNPTYIEQRGHPRLRMRHMPFKIGTAERDRWIEMMDEAMVETKVPAIAAEPLRAFFVQVADFMRNVPDESEPLR
ncbi:MAG: globin [Verrucomicrobiales bacterium]